MISTPLMLSTLATVALAGCAPMSAAPVRDQTEAGGAQTCFLPQAVRNYRTDGDVAVYVRDTRDDVFELRSSGCRGLTASRTLAVAPQQGGRACIGDMVTLATTGPSLNGENNSVCSARIQRRLDEGDLAALPSRLRP